MYRQPCRDTGNKKEQFTYRVRIARKYINKQLMIFLPEGKNSQSLIDKEYNYNITSFGGHMIWVRVKVTIRVSFNNWSTFVTTLQSDYFDQSPDMIINVCLRNYVLYIS